MPIGASADLSRVKAELRRREDANFRIAQRAARAGPAFASDDLRLDKSNFLESKVERGSALSAARAPQGRAGRG